MSGFFTYRYIVIDIEGETGEGKDYFELRQPGRLIMQALGLGILVFLFLRRQIAKIV